jgi:hypothetical protein
MKTSLAMTTAFALLSLACGDDTAGSAAKYPASTLPALCEQFGKALCDRAFACGIAASVADCAPYADELEAGCVQGTSELQAQIDAGALTLNYSAASACLAEVAASCTLDIDHCTTEDSVVVGKRALGAACGDSQECVAGAYCPIEGDACDGVCTAKGGEGDACEGGGAPSCADGLVCSGAVCAKGAGQGEACSFATPCAEGLACDQAVCKTPEAILAACPVEDPSCNIGGMSCSGGSAGASVCHFTYRTYGAAGAACDPADAEPVNEEVERACQLGLVCDPSAKICESTQPIGADCEAGESTCVFGAYCDATNKCAAVPGKGEVCTDLCAEDTVCLEGICKAPLAAGAACSEDRACASHDCSEGYCVAECTSP